MPTINEPAAYAISSLPLPLLRHSPGAAALLSLAAGTQCSSPGRPPEKPLTQCGCASGCGRSSSCCWLLDPAAAAAGRAAAPGLRGLAKPGGMAGLGEVGRRWGGATATSPSSGSSGTHCTRAWDTSKLAVKRRSSGRLCAGIRGGESQHLQHLACIPVQCCAVQCMRLQDAHLPVILHVGREGRPHMHVGAQLQAARGQGHSAVPPETLVSPMLLRQPSACQSEHQASQQPPTCRARRRACGERVACRARACRSMASSIHVSCSAGRKTCRDGMGQDGRLYGLCFKRNVPTAV